MIPQVKVLDPQAGRPELDPHNPWWNQIPKTVTSHLNENKK